MSDKSLRKERMKFFFRLSLFSSLLSLILFFLFLLTVSRNSAVAFILSSILVQIDIFVIIELSGMLFEVKEPKHIRIAIFLLVKILLLTAGLYGILYLFMSESLYVFLGISLPIAILTLIGLFEGNR